MNTNFRYSYGFASVSAAIIAAILVLFGFMGSRALLNNKNKPISVNTTSTSDYFYATNAKTAGQAATSSKQLVNTTSSKSKEGGFRQNSKGTDSNNDTASQSSLQAEYRSDQYGFNFAYPEIYPTFTQQTSVHQPVEELNIRRIRPSAADPPSSGAIKLKTNKIAEKEGYPSIHLHVTGLEKYFYINKSAGLMLEYNPVTKDWYKTSPPGENRQVFKPRTVSVGDRTGYRLGSRDAGYAYDGIAIPHPHRPVMIEIGFTTNPSTQQSIPRDKILNSFEFAAATNTSGNESSQQEYTYLLVRGRINLPNNEASFRPFTTVKTTPDRAEVIGQDSGNYTLIAYGENERVISQIQFEPSRGVSDPGGPSDIATFTIPVQTARKIKNMAIKSPEGDIMATKSASNNSPQVEVLQPNGGEHIEDQTTISWRGSDPDGDQLQYTIMYSNDGGQTYKALQTSWPRTKLEVDSLAGTNKGIIKVRATDGFNTAVDRSDGTFTVPNRKPTVRILEPESGATKENRHTFFDLDGSAYDPEDGHLSGDSLIWKSDKEGVLTTGERGDLWADEISLGKHTITLKAVDSGGASATATTTIRILPNE